MALARLMAVNQAAIVKCGPMGHYDHNLYSRGYTEEIEHWAWCIRNNAPDQPPCRPEVALGDAVIALATNVAIDNSIKGKGGYLAFQDEWYDINSDETPDSSSLKDENEKLGAKLS